MRWIDTTIRDLMRWIDTTIATRGGVGTTVCTTIVTGVWVRQTVLVCITHGLGQRWRHEEGFEPRSRHEEAAAHGLNHDRDTRTPPTTAR